MGLIDQIKNMFVPKEIKGINVELQELKKINANENNQYTPEQIKESIQRYNAIKQKYNEIEAEYKKLIKNEPDEKKKEDLKTILDVKERTLADAAMYASCILKFPKDENRWKYTFDEAMAKVDFVNSYSQEKKSEIANNVNNIVNKIKNNTQNQDLRFHSTPIHNAIRILESKSITSSEDRYDGYHASTDGHGRISVVQPKDLDFSISFWFDLYKPFYPCGAIFVLEPQKDGDFPDVKQMDSVDFASHPEQLKAIITTPDNIEILQAKMREVGLNPFLVQTFECFYEQNKVKEPRQVLTPEMEREREEAEKAKYIDQDKILEEAKQDVEIKLNIASMKDLEASRDDEGII